MVRNNNRYDVFVILQALVGDVRIDRVITPLIMLLSFLMIFVISPIAIFLFASMIFYADLPVFDHRLIMLFANTELMFFAYTVVLIFYFIAVSDGIVNTDGIAYKKAIKFLWACAVLTPLPLLINGYSASIISVYIVCFALAMYYISKAYLNEDGDWIYSVQNERNTDFSTDDYGIYGGLIDDPLRISDDINRARLTVTTATEGFLWTSLFVKITLELGLYYVAITNKKYIRECAYFLDALFEKNMKMSNIRLSLYAKTILRQKGYIIFMPTGVHITEKAELLAQKAAHG